MNEAVSNPNLVNRGSRNSRKTFSQLLSRGKNIQKLRAEWRKSPGGRRSLRLALIAPLNSEII